MRHTLIAIALLIAAACQAQEATYYMQSVLRSVNAPQARQRLGVDTLVSNGLSQVTGGYTSTFTNTGTVYASNLVHTTWKWVDVLISGESIASNPSGDPPQFLNVPGQAYFGYGYFPDDRAYFSVQAVHKLAVGNVWFEPHAHVMSTNNGAGSQATFVMDLYYGNVYAQLTNYVTRTNVVTLTNTYGHYMVSFGNVTNAALSGRSSPVFKGRIMRIAGGAGDIGNLPVFVDSIDIHMPVQELGSIGQGGD